MMIYTIIKNTTMTDLKIQQQAEMFCSRYGEEAGFARVVWDACAKWMQEQNEWISVDVKPDKEFADILLYFGGEDCSCSGYYVKNANVFMAHNVMYRGLKATHWQNLPSPPKTKQNERQTRTTYANNKRKFRVFKA